jgi:hypothetical protein
MNEFTSRDSTALLAASLKTVQIAENFYRHLPIAP